MTRTEFLAMTRDEQAAFCQSKYENWKIAKQAILDLKEREGTTTQAVAAVAQQKVLAAFADPVVNV